MAETNRIETLSVNAEPGRVAMALERDGCVIIEEALDSRQLATLNADLDALVGATTPGVRQSQSNDHGVARDTVENSVDLPSDPAELLAAVGQGTSEELNDLLRQFYGDKTVRIDGLPGKSRTFIELICHPVLLAAADHFLLPNCHRYLLNTGQLIEIQPGESAQTLHQDGDAWLHYTQPRPELSVEAMFALTDFTRNNGATRIVPGSHCWEVLREPEAHEMAVAEMRAGSAVLYLGSTVHGGGANQTTDERRRGMFLGFCLGWLRTEENFFLSTPMDAVREMPRQVQALLGYESHVGIGVVNIDSPMNLLRRSS
jgi:ectoine hydroxylase-related dioxygenase (phytanoyl-CoA dioxygenase family)